MPDQDHYLRTALVATATAMCWPALILVLAKWSFEGEDPRSPLMMLAILCSVPLALSIGWMVRAWTGLFEQRHVPASEAKWTYRTLALAILFGSVITATRTLPLVEDARFTLFFAVAWINAVGAVFLWRLPNRQG